MNERDNTLLAFDRLLSIMDELREKCPWDREQTFDTLRPLTIEETYELSDAILNHNHQDLVKELGDLLLHIVFYAKIGSEQRFFTMEDVIQKLSDKLIYRHPHVFGATTVHGSGEVVENWEKLKIKEGAGNRGVLSGVPSGLPALIKAYRMQDKARAVGFDWEVKEQVWDKVQEELGEFKEAQKKSDAKEMEEEFGDLLFSLINAARLYGINPETALERTNQKFLQRFNHIEQEILKNGKTFENTTPAELNTIWEHAKTVGAGFTPAQIDTKTSNPK